MESLSAEVLVWCGILLCLSQSAMFSGLNLALLGITRLRVEVEAHSGNVNALKILELRKDSNFLLTTILWGNVAVNVVLTLLCNSVMAGVAAFLFSTVLITAVGEIAPQAYFSRHAMRMGALLAPVLKFYQWLLYPVAKPSALVLDIWLGKEGINYFREQDLRTVIRKHTEADHSGISRVEGLGATNFLELDDVAVGKLGESIDPNSIIMLPKSLDNTPIFPPFERDPQDDFLMHISRSNKKWLIIVDEKKRPYMALNTNTFLFNAMFSSKPFKPSRYCHQPIIVNDANTQLGAVLLRLKVHSKQEYDHVIDDDLIVVWAEQKRVITGTDILGRLLAGITLRTV